MRASEREKKAAKYAASEANDHPSHHSHPASTYRDSAFSVYPALAASEERGQSWEGRGRGREGTGDSGKRRG